LKGGKNTSTQGESTPETGPSQVQARKERRAAVWVEKGRSLGGWSGDARERREGEGWRKTSGSRQGLTGKGNEHVLEKTGEEGKRSVGERGAKVRKHLSLR